MAAMEVDDEEPRAPVSEAEVGEVAALLRAWGPASAAGPATEGYEAGRVAAGEALVALSTEAASGRSRALYERCGGLEVAAAVIRAGDGSSLAARRQACAILANVCAAHWRGREAVLGSAKCMVSVSGAFCMDKDAEVVHDAASVLCAAAKREVWGPCLELDLVCKRLGWQAFALCCAMEGPEVKRTDAEDLLVKKLFELLWRLKSHRGTKAFEACCDLTGRMDPLTAAISYVYDPRAQELRDKRHPRDGPVTDVRPSGLDCCLRAMEGLALHDAKRDDALGKSRLSRNADAARALRATYALNGNERASRVNFPFLRESSKKNTRRGEGVARESRRPERWSLVPK